MKKRVPWNKGKRIFDPKKYAREWYQKNKEKQNKKVMESYYRDKKKWNSRSQTRRFLKEGKIFLEEKCKDCNRDNDLEIHHERYPTTRRGIEIAVKRGEIYRLCKKCHAEKKKDPDWTKRNQRIVA